MRDHGGDLDRAREAYGASDWLDLSTGINPVAYPLPQLPSYAFTALPTHADIAALEAVAGSYYGTNAQVVALAGAQAAIQLFPRLRPPGRAMVLRPSYNEHAASLLAQGWRVTEVQDTAAMEGADLAVVVNPNNPDGRRWAPREMALLAERVGHLVVDESFADPHPDLSLAPHLAGLGERVILLRSFGKFFGLAGLRLGFVLGCRETIGALRALAGPWAVSGPAIIAGKAALADRAWQSSTISRLITDVARLDGLAARAGWTLVGGTALFRTYETGDARAAQDRLARAAIWTRAFPHKRSWLRLGLPGHEEAWARLEETLSRSCK